MATVGKDFNREHKADLRRFVHYCQLNGYGHPEAKPEATTDGGKIMSFQDGDYRGIDVWYGGEPFAGALTVWYQDIPCFQMAYQGAVRSLPRQAEVYVALSEALQLVNVDYPWRGPAKYVASNGLLYLNAFDGHLRNFSGKEQILLPSTKQVLYIGRYMGRIINMTP